jgi:hypothetical protein
MVLPTFAETKVGCARGTPRIKINLCAAKQKRDAKSIPYLKLIYKLETKSQSRSDLNADIAHIKVPTANTIITINPMP